MAELADAQDLGSCGDSVWVQVPLPAPRRNGFHSVPTSFLRSKKGRHPLRYIRSSFQNRSQRLRFCVWEASVPLRLLLLSNPNPLRWASDLFFCAGGWEGGSSDAFFAEQKRRHPLRYIRFSFQNRSRRLRFCVWEASVPLRFSFQIRSHRLRVCGWGGIRFGSFVHSFNLKPEGSGVGWAV